MRLHNRKIRRTSSSVRRLTLIEQLEARTLLSASALDTEFSGDGIAPAIANAQFTATVVRADGKIIAVGHTTSGDRDMIVARYNVNGTLDTSFSGDGLAYVDLRDDDYATAVALTPQGKIVVGGYTTSTFDVGTDFAIARLNANGTLDGSFSGDGKVAWHVGTTDDRVNDIAIQDDGAVLLVGTSTPNVFDTRESRIVVARLTATGDQDTTFGGFGSGLYRADAGGHGLTGSSIDILPTGRLVVAGTAHAGQTPHGPYERFYLLALNENGTRATDVFTSNLYDWADYGTYSYGGHGTVVSGATLHDLVVLPNGNVAAVGAVSRWSSEYGTYIPFNGLLLLDTAGGVLKARTAGLGVVNEETRAGTGVAYSDGSLYVTGSLSYGPRYLARYDASDLTPDVTFAPDALTPGMRRYTVQYNGEVAPPRNGLAVDQAGRIVVVSGDQYFKSMTEVQQTVLFRVVGDPVDNSQSPVTLQAESAFLTGGTGVASQHSGYNGTGYADFGGQGSAVTFTFNRESPALVTLLFRFANGSTGPRPMAIYVNGEQVNLLQFSPQGGWGDWGTVNAGGYLVEGANTIQIVATTAAGGANLDQMTIVPVVPTTTLEAEAARFYYGTLLGNNHAGYTGSGFADFNTRSRVQFRVNRIADGPVVITFRYANGSAIDRPLTIDSSSGTTTTLAFPPTGSWSTWRTVSVTVPMIRSVNSLNLWADSAGGPNLDSLTIGDTKVVQLEDVRLIGVTQQSSNGGYTGSGYADLGTAGSYVELPIDRAAGGATTVQLRYANGSTSGRPLRVAVNGAVTHANLTMPNTGSWSSWGIMTLTLDLTAGANVVRLINNTNEGVNLDSLTVISGSANMATHR
ncbi:MAG TPA: carbohydrate-binding protein [Tepidisphaeraceae bacterium]|nr:carbohydrate-binding protein [Tepidisphaeraceae bacterium]